MSSTTTKLAVILNAWKNYYLHTNEVGDIAKERAAICAECEHCKEIDKKIMGKWFRYLGCDLCGCPVSKKVYGMRKENKCEDKPPRW